MNVEDLLTDALQDHADRAAYDATPLAAIALHARRLQGSRRRRTTSYAVGAAAAATVAVLVTTAALRPPPESSGPATGTPAPTPSATAIDPRPTSPPSSLQPATDGSAPAIGYVEGRTFHPPTGQPVRLPELAKITGLAVLDDGFIVSDYREADGGTHLSRLDETGALVADLGCGIKPVSRGRLVAWVQFSCTYETSASNGLHLLDLDTGEELVQADSGADDLAITGRQVVYDTGDGNEAYVTDLVAAPRRIPGLGSVSGVTDDGLVAGNLDVDGGSTGAVVTLTGEVVWERPDLYPYSVSPGGIYLLAVPPGDAQQLILDMATGRTISQVSGSGPDDFPTFVPGAWEDDTHLIGDLLLNCCTPMARVSLDGELRPIAGNDAIGGSRRVWVPGERAPSLSTDTGR